MQTVVITGSTRGLGFEMAKEFRKSDFNVVVCGTNDSGIEKAIGELGRLTGKGELLGVKCNVSKREEVETLCNAASDKFGNIDIWINNAGVNQSFKKSSGNSRFFKCRDESVPFVYAININCKSCKKLPKSA